MMGGLGRILRAVGRFLKAFLRFFIIGGGAQ
jgi:hypothetical protein